MGGEQSKDTAKGEQGPAKEDHVSANGQIIVRDIMKRLNAKPEVARGMRLYFDQLQENQVITAQQFRMNVIGPQLPSPISDRMYTKFAT